MPITTTQTLPPAYIAGIGEQFSDYFMGGHYEGPTDNQTYVPDPISGSPFYTDPNQMYGGSYDSTTGFTGIGGGTTTPSDWFVSGMDPMQTDAQSIAQGTMDAPTTGLGGYQDYLTDADAIQTAASGLLGTTGPGGTFTAGPMAGGTAMGNAASAANLGSLAAISGQGAANPYMQAAASGLGTAGATTAGAAGYQGANAYQQFMSPYQQQVIDATMAEYDTQAQAQQAALGASAGNAYGGGRFGVAQGQLAADQGTQRALLQAQLLSQGFGQAQNQANQAFGQQLGWGTQQANQAGQQLGIGQQALGQATGNVGLYGSSAGMQGQIGGQQQSMLGNQLAQLGALQNQGMAQGQFGTTGLGNLLNTYTTMGQQNQLQNQATQDQMAALMSGIQMAPTQTMGNLGQFMAAAYGTPSSTTYQQTPDPSTLQTLLGGGIGLAGIIGAMSGN